jgi:hypothetical protein
MNSEINTPQLSNIYVSPEPNNQSYGFSKDFIIMILIIVLVLSVLGINIFLLFGMIIQYIVYLITPLLSIFGYTTGSIINTTSELAGDASHFGIDIAEGTVQDVGNLLIATSDPQYIPTLPPAAKTYPMAVLDAIGRTLSMKPVQTSNDIIVPSPSPSVPFSVPAPSPSIPISVPAPSPSLGNVPASIPSVPASDTTENPVQNPISSNKSQWCLIGEYQQRNGCIEVDDMNKCMSGQVFPSQQMCLNPNATQNIVPTNNKAAISGYYTQYGVLLPQIVYK